MKDFPEKLYVKKGYSPWCYAATSGSEDFLYSYPKPEQLIEVGQTREVALYEFVRMVKISDKVSVEKVT